MSAPPDHYRHITAAEAYHSLGIPVGTIWSWRSRHKLYEVGRESDGTRRYRLEDVLRLDATRRSLRDGRTVCKGEPI